jgi:hypothetical protein
MVFPVAPPAHAHAPEEDCPHCGGLGGFLVGSDLESYCMPCGGHTADGGTHVLGSGKVTPPEIGEALT